MTDIVIYGKFQCHYRNIILKYDLRKNFEIHLKEKQMFQSILFDIFRDQKLWPINTKLIGYDFERLKY